MRRWPYILLGVVIALAVGRYLAGTVRDLEWQHGIGRPKDLRYLRDVSKTTGLQFPRGSLLIDGEYLGGLSPYLIAKIKLPPDGPRVFLRQDVFLGYEKTTTRGLDERRSPQVRRRGWILSRIQKCVVMNGILLPRNRGAVWVLIDFDEPRDPILYLYYQN